MLLSPALAWLRDRRWAPIVKALRPELGLLQIAPRPIVEGVVRRFVGAQGGWADAGVDEFLRAYLTPRGRAAFYAAARSIYLDEPHGENGFWTRMAELAPRSLFVWGRQRHARADRLHEARGGAACRRPRTSSSTAATCPSSRRRARPTPAHPQVPRLRPAPRLEP